MSVKLEWFYEMLESDDVSEFGKLRAARLLHIIEFPEDQQEESEPQEVDD